jgi:hypothetical protein
MRLAAVISVAIISGGCSASGRIAENANEVRRLAESSRGRFDAIGTEARAQAPDLVSIAREADGGSSEQQAIILATAGIVEALPGVADVTPWWATLIARVMVALAVVGVAVILWTTGIGSLVKRALWSFGLLLPKSAVSDADLARSMLDPSRPESAREYVAARRASDSAFAAAWEKASRKPQQETRT